jgi:hypothetical protein
MFRDDFGDPAAANQLGQHIGIAEDQLVMIEALPARLEQVRDGRGMTNELMGLLARQWAQGWERAWQQLEEARALVAQRGRDVKAFDAARAAAGDIWNDVAKGRAVAAGNSVHWTWENVSTQPARDAIAALRMAVPEVVVVQPAPLDASAMDLSPTSHKVVQALQVVGGLALAGFVIWVLMHLFM